MFGGGSITSVLLFGLLFISSVICDRKFREKKQAVTGCQNGGTVNQCTCPANFNGQFCENVICKNGGTPTSSGACICTGNYFGNNCEKSCKTGTTLLRDSSNNLLGCYMFLTTSDTWYNWNGATTGCSKYGATLVVIDSAAKNDAIANHIATLPTTDLGACGTQFFTAGQRAVDGVCQPPNEFFWKPVGGTQTPASYTNFKLGQPDCYGTKGESCIAIYTAGGIWNDFNCDGVACAICEQPPTSS